MGSEAGIDSRLSGCCRRQRGRLSRPSRLGSESTRAAAFGLPGWGPKAAALVLSQYHHFEAIPRDWRKWNPSIRGAERLANVLLAQWNDALLYRTLATLKLDVPVFETVDELEWKGPQPQFERFCERLRAPALHSRAIAARDKYAERSQASL